MKGAVMWLPGEYKGEFSDTRRNREKEQSETRVW